MKKRILLLIITIIYSVNVFGQAEPGIHFEKVSSLEELFAKAKTEHKYIFMDCYATWCGPCKWMDANVYALKTVGAVYNSQFICVKVQMDQTATDDSQVKNWYGTAKFFIAQRHHVTAYPTFLFFDPEGMPVHKITGSMDAKAFLQMAADAQNPEKQYYSIVKNFQPGKLDTAEEKSVARLLKWTDNELSCRMAFDYLSRIPRSQLDKPDNSKLMIEFQNDPNVLSIAIDFVQAHGVEINRNFIEQFSEQPVMMKLIADSMRNLSPEKFSEEANLRFIMALHHDAIIRQLAEGYINQLAKDSLYAKKNIFFIASFTKSTTDRGFDLFYHQTDRINSVIQNKNYAQDRVYGVLYNLELYPLLSNATATGIAPDFDSLRRTLVHKYDAVNAEKVIINGEVAWYSYLVYNKKQQQYYPQLNELRIKNVQTYHLDTVKGKTQLFTVNNSAYSIFLKSDDLKQLEIATEWLRQIVKDNPDNSNCADTYACLLYKTGKTDEALKWEQKALELAIIKKDGRNITAFTNGLEKMKKGEKIWLEKEYQDN